MQRPHIALNVMGDEVKFEPAMVKMEHGFRESLAPIQSEETRRSMRAGALPKAYVVKDRPQCVWARTVKSVVASAVAPRAIFMVS